MDIKDVENLARLARIELSEDEKRELLSDMESILGYVRTVEKAETGETEKEQGIYNVWREDEIESREFSKELIIERFPDAKDGFLKVKKIL